MPCEVTASWETLMKQAGDTAEDYMRRAKEILDTMDVEYTTTDLISLVNGMHTDYRTSALLVAAQEQRNTLCQISAALYQIAEALENGNA